MSTVLGWAAVEELLHMTPYSEPQLIGWRDNDVIQSPLMERVAQTHEGITLDDLRDDVAQLKQGFAVGKRLGLMIRSENADPIYTTPFLVALFEKEGGGLFDVRQVILGHVQRGGRPSPFDRIQATRLATRALLNLIEAAEQGSGAAVAIGRQAAQIQFTDLTQLPNLIEPDVQRPKDQRWLVLPPVARIMAQPEPQLS